MFENEVVQTDGDMCGWMDERMHVYILVYMYRWTDGWMDG